MADGAVASSLELAVVTPQGQVLEKQVDEVTAPGVLGEFGVLPGHIAFISATRSGVLSYRKGAERGKIAVGTGLVEVDGKGKIIALMERAVLGEKVKGQEAEQLARDAEARLKKLSGDERDQADQETRRQAQDDLDWAQAQLSAR